MHRGDAVVVRIRHGCSELFQKWTLLREELRTCEPKYSVMQTDLEAPKTT